MSPDGRILSAAEWAEQRDDWLPTDAEKVHVGSLMKPAFGPGEMAGWIAPPATGINTQAVDYDYVRI